MTNFIPIFPLALVVYPGEQVNLHIFEPRYRQLINECFEQKKPFGIPPVIKSKISDTGTLVEIKEISERYEDGKLDIKTEGLGVFIILEIVKELPDKLYSGAIVTYPENTLKGSASLMQKILLGIRKVYEQLNIQKDFKKPDDELLSYDIAHHAGMDIENEYRMLELFNELQRQEFLKRHLAKVIPVLNQMDLLKKKIRLNGHFKNLEGFRFN